jgi:hypothetical protein
MEMPRLYLEIRVVTISAFGFETDIFYFGLAGCIIMTNLQLADGLYIT